MIDEATIEYIGGNSSYYPLLVVAAHVGSPLSERRKAILIATKLLAGESGLSIEESFALLQEMVIGLGGGELYPSHA